MPAAKKRLPPTRAEVQAQWKDYFATLPPDARRAVKRLLAEIEALAPQAIPVFSYRIPGFRLHDRQLLWAAGYSKHVSLYPITAKLQRANAKALAGLKTSTGTVQFSLAKPLPIPLVRQLVKGRVAEALREASKRTVK